MIQFTLVIYWSVDFTLLFE